MPASTRPIKALFYVQHLLGIGHFVRAGILASAMDDAGIRVTLVSGGVPVAMLDPAVTRFAQLPPTRALDETFKVLVDERGEPVGDDWKALRRERLLEIYEDELPDILLLEMYPFGRRQMRFEIEPLLDRARERRAESGLPLIASSVRDILVAPENRQRMDDMLDRARRDFDLVLVHGDPDLIHFEETFPGLRDIADLLRSTGYVVNPAATPGGPGAPGRGEVIVSAGGGAVSEVMLRAAIESRALTRLARHPWRVLVGHNYPDSDFRKCRQAAPQGVIVERARDDFRQLLANCELSISQAGYNTVIEVLTSGAPAVLLPYAGGRETEQTLRCRLLARRGLVQVVEKHEVSAEKVARAVDRAMENQRAAAPPIDTRGAERSVEILRSAVIATVEQ